MSQIARWGQRGGIPFFNGAAGASQGTSWYNVAPITTTGTIDSGIQGADAIGATKWGFQAIGTPTGSSPTFSVTIYGTYDPVAYNLWENGTTAFPGDLSTQQTPWGTAGYNWGQGRGNTTLPSTSWFVIPAQAEETGTGTPTNPIVATGVVLPYNQSGLVAVRAVITTTGVTGGTLQVIWFACQ